MYRVPRSSALERLSSGDQSMMHVWRMCLGSEFAALRRVSWTLYRSSLRPGNETTLACDQATFSCWNATAFPLHGLTLQVDMLPSLRRTNGLPPSVAYLAQILLASASLRSLHLECLVESDALDVAPLAQLISLRDLAVVTSVDVELRGVSALGKLKHVERLVLKASPLKELMVQPSVRQLDLACDHSETLVGALPRLEVLSLRASAFAASLWSEIVDRGTRLHTLRLDVQRSVSARWGDTRPKNIRTAALTHLDLARFQGTGWPGMLLPTLRHLDLCCDTVYQVPKGSEDPFTRACPAALETCRIYNDMRDNETILCRTLACVIVGPSVHSLRGLELSGLADMDVDLSCLQSCSALRRLQIDGINDLPRMPGLTDLSIGSQFTKPLHKQVGQLARNMPGLLVLRISWLTRDPCVHVLSQLPRLRHLCLRTGTRSDTSDCLDLGFCQYGTCPSGDTVHFPSLRLLQVNYWEFDAEAHWANQCRDRGITVSHHMPTWSVHGTHDTG